MKISITAAAFMGLILIFSGCGTRTTTRTTTYTTPVLTPAAGKVVTLRNEYTYTEESMFDWMAPSDTSPVSSVWYVVEYDTGGTVVRDTRLSAIAGQTCRILSATDGAALIAGTSLYSPDTRAWLYDIPTGSLSSISLPLNCHGALLAADGGRVIAIRDCPASCTDSAVPVIAAPLNGTAAQTLFELSKGNWALSPSWERDTGFAVAWNADTIVRHALDDTLKTTWIKSGFRQVCSFGGGAMAVLRGADSVDFCAWLQDTCVITGTLDLERPYVRSLSMDRDSAWLVHQTSPGASDNGLNDIVLRHLRTGTETVLGTGSQTRTNE